MRNDALRAPANDDQQSHPLPPPARIQELLFDAARLGRGDMVPALIQAGADVAAIDRNGHSALILSAYYGHAEASALLLAEGAPVDQGDGARGNTALMGAAFKGFGHIAELLLAAGARPDAVNRAGQTALMLAALFGRSAIVDTLIAHGANPHMRDAAGNSAVSLARAQSNELMAARLTAGSRLPA